MHPLTSQLLPLLLLSSFAVGFPADRSGAEHEHEHAPQAQKTPANPVAKIADAYLDVAFSVEGLDKSGTYMHKDITFIDPTAEVWPGGVASKGIQGRDRFIALQKSWGIVESSFEPSGGFESGAFALRVGKLSWKGAQGPA